MRHNRRAVSGLLFGGIALALFTLLALTTVRSAGRDKAAILDNALAQGYWIARSLEIGHSMVLENHLTTMRSLVKEIQQHAVVRSLALLDEHRQVLLASQEDLEGTPWPEVLEHPPAHGRILRTDAQTTTLVFPAFFPEVVQRLGMSHPHHDSALDKAKWIILALDTSEGYAHYRASVIQSILVSLGTVILGLAAWGFFGMMQRYQLASASIATLENMKQYLARFVPSTVQRLIEDNPEQPMLDKVEREATILFLDIDHYTRIAEDLSPEALNYLIEKYFSVFLDIILSHGGEINETAGDSMMAIFTGKTPRAHALNAARAAVAIREQVQMLNRTRAPHEPEIFVNLGINTGQVLLGATMMKGTVGERFTYTASGMVTNIASRLCDLGNKGEIHLSDTTAQMVQDDFTLSGPHERHLKHIGGPVRIYTIVGSA